MIHFRNYFYFFFIYLKLNRIRRDSPGQLKEED